VAVQSAPARLKKGSNEALEKEDSSFFGLKDVLLEDPYLKALRQRMAREQVALL
jgi:hypothetical protein